MDHHKRRTFIKNKPQNLWRDNFKKHCLEQFRRSREAQINQRRFGSKEILSEEELLLQFIKDEWKRFLLNEERFTGDLDADLAAATEEELLQDFKRESSRYNLEEEAEFVLQFEPDEMYQDELVQKYSQNFEYSQGLYDSLICSNCFQYELSPVEDGRFSLFQCPGCNLYDKFRKNNKFESE